MNFARDVLPILIEVLKLLQADLRLELSAQGHRLTGKLEDSITYEVVEDKRSCTGKMFYADYGEAMELGVRAERIPFGKGKGGGQKTSLYIQGLIEFWEERGLSDREAIGAAFATAHVHAREGMPTRASHRFSETGERVGFARTVIERKLDDIASIIEKRYGATLELRFAENFRTDTIRLAA